MSTKNQTQAPDALYELPAPSGSQNEPMGMMLWYATEGGRKCPMCGRYAKREQLGNLSFYSHFKGGVARVSAYGHKLGFGCNVSANVELTNERKNQR